MSEEDTMNLYIPEHNIDSQARALIHIVESITAELLARAHALSRADRCHFELNLADLLD